MARQNPGTKTQRGELAGLAQRYLFVCDTNGKGGRRFSEDYISLLDFARDEFLRPLRQHLFIILVIPGERYCAPALNRLHLFTTHSLRSAQHTHTTRTLARLDAGLRQAVCAEFSILPQGWSPSPKARAPLELNRSERAVWSTLDELRAWCVLMWPMDCGPAMTRLWTMAH